MTATSEARKRREEALPQSGEWSVSLSLDGVPVCDAAPCTDWDAAQILAPFVAGWLGGPVSITNAVIATRTPPPMDAPSLFDEVTS